MLRIVVLRLDGFNRQGRHVVVRAEINTTRQDERLSLHRNIPRSSGDLDGGLDLAGEPGCPSAGCSFCGLRETHSVSCAYRCRHHRGRRVQGEGGRAGVDWSGEESQRHVAINFLLIDRAPQRITVRERER